MEKDKKEIKAVANLRKLLAEARDRADGFAIELAAARERIDKLTKEAASNKSTSDHWYTAMNQKNEEISALHVVIDLLPGAPPKRQENSHVELSLAARLAAWFGAQFATNAIKASERRVS